VVVVVGVGSASRRTGRKSFRPPNQQSSGHGAASQVSTSNETERAQTKGPRGDEVAQQLSCGER
jgi:hypothetical protein